VTANQVSATVVFEFGRTTAYGHTAAAPSVAGVTAQPVSATVTGLLPNATYHFRVTATSPDGTSASTDETFTTAKPPPPRLTDLKVKLGRKGASVIYRDSEAATTAFVVFRLGSHKRMKKVGSFTHGDSAGRNSVAFTRKRKRLRLAAGTYLLRATPTIDGVKGGTAKVKFKVA
jgi:hypothetical protein